MHNIIKDLNWRYATKKFDSSKRGASAFPVLIFELGIFGVLLFFMDILYLFYIVKKKDSYLRVVLVVFLLSVFLYPIFKLLMYICYYFMARSLIIKNVNCQNIKRINEYEE